MYFIIENFNFNFLQILNINKSFHQINLIFLKKILTTINER